MRGTSQTQPQGVLRTSVCGLGPPFSHPVQSRARLWVKRMMFKGAVEHQGPSALPHLASFPPAAVVRADSPFGL